MNVFLQSVLRSKIQCFLKNSEVGGMEGSPTRAGFYVTWILSTRASPATREYHPKAWADFLEFRGWFSFRAWRSSGGRSAQNPASVASISGIFYWPSWFGQAILFDRPTWWQPRAEPSEV